MIDLNDYGWNEELYAERRSLSIPGRILEVHREIHQVICQYGEVSARLKGNFYRTESLNNFPVVGDFVGIIYNANGESLIQELYPRKSKFSRADFSGHKAGYVKTLKEQVLVSNFDYVFIMVSLNHDFNLNRIERYLTIALQSGGKPVIVLTKADCKPDYPEFVEKVRKLTNKAPVYAVSSVSGIGLENLNKYFATGKTIAFLGSSGVGKSTLLNTIAGKEIMKVKDIREKDSKGRHTTTHRQLIMLPTKTMIIDTPGIRELGMWDAQKGIEEEFSDIIDLIGRCKFSDCQHEKEPGCAIIEALDTGGLSQERWIRYLKLNGENQWGATKSAGFRLERLQARSMKKGKMK